MKELAQSDRQQLLALARAAVEAAARRDPKPALDPAALSPELLAPAAAFVTIHEHGELRGCIGMMRFDVPLWENVREAAAGARSSGLSVAGSSVGFRSRRAAASTAARARSRSCRRSDCASFFIGGASRDKAKPERTLYLIHI